MALYLRAFCLAGLAVAGGCGRSTVFSTTTTGATSSGATTGSTSSGSSTGGSSTGGSQSSCAVLGEGTPCTAASGLWGICCGGSCTDPAHDPLNCRACNFACPAGWICDYGGCESLDGGAATACPPGTAWVGLSCLSTSCSEANSGDQCALGDGGEGACCGGKCASSCAECGYACGAGETCGFVFYCGLSGTCAVGPTCSGACPPGTWNTGGLIGGPSLCIPSSCAAGGLGEGLPCAYDAGQMTYGICCAGGCVDNLTDPENCGVCGNACPSGSFCAPGGGGDGCPVVGCAGAAAETLCVLDAGVTGYCCGDSCVDENSDATACGRCGIQCPVGESCSYGNCRTQDGGFLGCSPELSSCPGATSCVEGDCLEQACGADGQRCAFGEQTGECCGGRCTDPLHDPQNCGGCGVGSAAGVCLAGDAFPIPYDAGLSEPCAGFAGYDGPYCADPGCGCLAGGPPGIGCLVSPLCTLGDGGPALCCDVGVNGGTCIDALNDPNNCGDCGVACPSGQTCVQGSCSGTEPACGPGFTGGFCNLDAGPSFLCCPGGGCTDTLGDPNNCGACGVICDAGCSAGSCR